MIPCSKSNISCTVVEGEKKIIEIFRHLDILKISMFLKNKNSFQQSPQEISDQKKDP